MAELEWYFADSDSGAPSNWCMREREFKDWVDPLDVVERLSRKREIEGTLRSLNDKQRTVLKLAHGMPTDVASRRGGFVDQALGEHGMVAYASCRTEDQLARLESLCRRSIDRKATSQDVVWIARLKNESQAEHRAALRAYLHAKGQTND